MVFFILENVRTRMVYMEHNTSINIAEATEQHMDFYRKLQHVHERTKTKIYLISIEITLTIGVR